MEVDAALDVSLVTALFSAVDQMMISHDVVEYDVAWPQAITPSLSRGFMMALWWLKVVSK
jgi:hypothetical protein